MTVDFSVIRDAVSAQFERMHAGGNHLYKVDLSKDEMWDTYLGSFPEGSNPIFRERTAHDCQCCKQFIRLMGNVVAVVDGERRSVWDVPLDMGPDLNAVVMGMAALVANAPIVRPFFHYEPTAGTSKSHGLSPDGEIEAWEHFHVRLPGAVLLPKGDIDSHIGKVRATKEVFERGLREISFDAINVVLELIEQKSLYKGEEFRDTIGSFLGYKIGYTEIDSTENKLLFAWAVARNPGAIGVARLRNTSIGTLLVDLSEGMDLDGAVGKFEAMVAPSNYKRPKALITQGMIDRAQKDVEELGYTDALPRRFAVTEDISVLNVLFADRGARGHMKDGAFDLLSASKAVSLKSLSKVEEVDIATFLTDIIPHATTLELLMENRHQGNLMSLIAPVDAEANNMLKWDNNFSWTYNGEVTDSMKERVKAAGGKVDGVLRFSLQWNESGQNNIDFDAHCHEPDGNHIYFPNKGQTHPSSGRLDVDIVSPDGKVAVENIAWTHERKMQQGVYRFNVHNYSHDRSKEGFSCEIEHGGEIHTFEYAKVLSGNETVHVAVVEYSYAQGLVFKEMLPSTVASTELWGVNTMQYTKVAMVMNSPNHWDDNATGNRHTFFILNECVQPGEVRGFYNEFLSSELNDHRKVFEMLGAKMRVAASDNQLSGLGFSSTQRNHVFCRVTGSFNRVIKITF